MRCFLRQKNLGPAKMLLTRVLYEGAERSCCFVCRESHIRRRSRCNETRIELQAVQLHSYEILDPCMQGLLGVLFTPLHNKPSVFISYF